MRWENGVFLMAHVWKNTSVLPGKRSEVRPKMARRSSLVSFFLRVAIVVLVVEDVTVPPTKDTNVSLSEHGL